MNEKIVVSEDFDFLRLERKILKERGFALDQYNRGYIQRRIAVRMRARNVDTYAEYTRFLDIDPEEYNRLFDVFTINVTQFFRDPSVFEAVRNQVFPTLLQEKKEKRDNTIRIWSVGCASGEEPYTIAILLKEVFREEIRKYLISIYATDIDRECLLKTKEGIYSKESVVDLKKEYLNKYFTPLPNERYKLSDEIKNMVTFKYHNLLNDPFFQALDVLFCRNVLFYFTREAREQILESFYRSLDTHGFLIIGKSELLFFSRARYYFYPFNPAEHIFRKERRSVEEKEYPGPEKRKKWWWGFDRPPEEFFGVRVLVVDDSAFMRLVLKNMLNHSGLAVVGEAENGVDAVEKYKKLKPTFVLMDLIMPVEDGLNAVKNLLNFDPQARVIMLSAVGQEMVVQEALRLGAKAYLAKPIVPETLTTIIRNLLLKK